MSEKLIFNAVNNKLNSLPITDDILINYYVGLLEADGSFCSKSPYLDIVQHSLDSKLMQDIAKLFNIEGVYVNPRQPQYTRVRVTNKEGFFHVYNLINGKLITEHRFSQFKGVCDKLGLEALKGDINNIHPAWITGFTDGSGSLTVKIGDHTVNTVFTISHKDPGVLHILNKYLFNNEKNITYWESKDLSTQNSTLRGNISTLSDLKKFFPYEFKTRKYNSLKIFTEIVSMKENKVHLTPQGLDLIKSEHKLMNNHNQGENWIGNSKLLYNNWEDLISEETKLLAKNKLTVSTVTADSLAFNPKFIEFWNNHSNRTLTNKRIMEELAHLGITNKHGLSYGISQVTRAVNQLRNPGDKSD